MEQALAGGDAPRLAELAHALKGGSASLGAVAAASVAARVEQSARDGHVEAAGEAVGELREAMSVSVAALREEVGAEL